jgi:hypothetical protein
MAHLTRTAFKALYGSSGTTFADNTTRLISEGDMRQFGEDIADSVFSGLIVQYTQGRIFAGRIRQLNSNPFNFVSPGSGYRVAPINVGLYLVSDGTAFATNTTIKCRIGTTDISEDNSTLLTRTSDYSLVFPDFITVELPAASHSSALNLYCETGDPTLGGDSYIDYIVVYHLFPDNYTSDPF